jgi:hypothetical protein
MNKTVLAMLAGAGCANSWWSWVYYGCNPKSGWIGVAVVLTIAVAMWIVKESVDIHIYKK